MKKLIFALLMVVPCAAWGATFGTDTEFASSDNISSVSITASKFTLGEAGTVTKISAYCCANDVADINAKACIFADSTGSPGTLLGTTQVTALVDYTNAWIDFTFSSGVELEAGDYWLGMIAESTNTSSVKFGALEGGVTKKGANTYSTPEDWSTTSGTDTGWSISINATYTTGGGGGTPSAFPQILIFQ